MKKLIIIISIILSVFLNMFLRTYKQPSWRELSRESAGIYDKKFKGNIVQVYAARTYGWRGTFAVHSWLAYKKKTQNQYTVLEVVGWRSRLGQQVIRKKIDTPDRLWFGNKPVLIEEIKGESASKAIERIESIIDTYSDQSLYRLWPGPNSNTFISHIIKNTEELTNSLPSNAIGKDWINNSRFYSQPASGKGFQLSLYGALGLTIDFKNGIEINILSLNIGFDFLCPAFKLPFIGRLGLSKLSCQ
jgi:hypothetical protein